MTSGLKYFRSCMSFLLQSSIDQYIVVINITVRKCFAARSLVGLWALIILQVFRFLTIFLAYLAPLSWCLRLLVMASDGRCGRSSGRSSMLSGVSWVSSVALFFYIAATLYHIISLDFSFSEAYSRMEMNLYHINSHVFLQCLPNG